MIHLMERLLWSAILGASNCVIRVLDAWEPELVAPIPEGDGYFTDLDE